MNNIHPDPLLEELKQGANARRRRSLDAINQVCREQHERGSKDFSIAMIARLSADSGGPKERTIRNPDGKPYRVLIEAWATFSRGHLQKPRASRALPYENILSSIKDDSVRVYFGERLAELRGLRNEVSLLKEHIRKEKSVIVDLRPSERSPKQEISTSTDVDPSGTVLSKQLLTQSEMYALRYSINEFVDEHGYQVAPNGRVITAEGRSVLPPGFVSAIRKILADG